MHTNILGAHITDPQRIPISSRTHGCTINGKEISLTHALQSTITSSYEYNYDVQQYTSISTSLMRILIMCIRDSINIVIFRQNMAL
jgi:hypothetical protein